MKAFIAKLEKTKVTEQAFRVVRIAALGVLSAKVTGSAVDAAGITAVVEAAFRQVFPVQAAAPVDLTAKAMTSPPASPPA